MLTLPGLSHNCHSRHIDCLYSNTAKWFRISDYRVVKTDSKQADYWRAVSSDSEKIPCNDIILTN